VIVFIPDEADASRAKPAEMVMLRVPQTISRVRMERVLDETGVPYRTLLGEHRVLVFLPEGTSDSPVRNAAQRLGAKMESEHGSGEIFGNDDRSKALAAYDRIIAEYELAHPNQALSSRLWSREWHDAESGTCTTAK
jgi:hypothetical protein